MEFLQIERQIERNGYPRDEAERRVASQMPIDDKKALADVVIDNSGELAETLRQVDGLYAEWVTSRSARSTSGASSAARCSTSR